MGEIVGRATVLRNVARTIDSYRHALGTLIERVRVYFITTKAA